MARLADINYREAAMSEGNAAPGFNPDTFMIGSPVRKASEHRGQCSARRIGMVN